MVRDSQLIWEAYTTSNEGALATAGHLALDVGGVVGDVVGAGEFFDIPNAIWYASEGQYLNAALSLISAIPVVGDIIGKGGKLAIYLSKTAKTVKPMGVVGRAAAKGIVKGSKAAVAVGPQIVKIKQVIRSNKAAIDGVLSAADKNEKLKPHVEKIRSALQAFSGEEAASPKMPTS